MSFPCSPVDTNGACFVVAMMVEAIQVRGMTGRIPPGSFIAYSTVAGPAIVISVLSREWVTTMTRKGITCSSWEKNDSAHYIYIFKN